MLLPNRRDDGGATMATRSDSYWTVLQQQAATEKRWLATSYSETTKNHEGDDNNEL
jgi:hypothetical protein